MSDEISKRRSVTHMQWTAAFFRKHEGGSRGCAAAGAGCKVRQLGTASAHPLCTVHINTHGIAQKACAMERVSLAMWRAIASR